MNLLWGLNFKGYVELFVLLTIVSNKRSLVKDLGQFKKRIKMMLVKAVPWWWRELIDKLVDTGARRYNYAGSSLGIWLVVTRALLSVRATETTTSTYTARHEMCNFCVVSNSTSSIIDRIFSSCIYQNQCQKFQCKLIMLWICSPIMLHITCDDSKDTIPSKTKVILLLSMFHLSLFGPFTCLPSFNT